MAFSLAAAPTGTRAKPRLSFWQIWNMSFGFWASSLVLRCRIQRRIFENPGGTEIALYWLAAPPTGMLVQPIIGYMSTAPEPEVGAAAAVFPGGGRVGLAGAAGDAQRNGPDGGGGHALDHGFEHQHQHGSPSGPQGDCRPAAHDGFAAQTFFIAGAVVASSHLDVYQLVRHQHTAPAGQIPLSAKYAFYIGGPCSWQPCSGRCSTPRNTRPTTWKSLRPKLAPLVSERHPEMFSGIFQHAHNHAPAVVQFFSWLALFVMWILHHSGRYQPHLPHHRHHLQALQRGR
jgi:maltose/moltooligosaccharide transporter